MMQGLTAFWERIDKSGDCWVWTGPRTHDGYGRATVDGQQWLTHRLTYTLAKGVIPAGLELDHLCRTRACVNPEHLEAVTRAENKRRGLHGILRTHCVHGHELTPENTRMFKRRRICRACNRDARARYVARLNLEVAS